MKYQIASGDRDLNEINETISKFSHVFFRLLWQGTTGLDSILA